MLLLKKILFKVIIIIISISTIENAFSKEYEIINICSESGFLPYEMRTESGEWIGYEIALITMFANDTGRKYTIKDMKFSELIPSLINNKGCDLIASALGPDPARAKNILFSSETYESAFAAIIRKEDEDKLDSFEAINKKSIRIAEEKNTEPIKYVRSKFNNANIIEYIDNKAVIKAILEKKADVYIDDSVSLSVVAKMNSDKLFLIKPNISPLFNMNILPANAFDGIAFVFRNNDEKFRNEFNDFFAKIKKNGDLKKLQKYYFEDMGWIKDYKLKD